MQSACMIRCGEYRRARMTNYAVQKEFADINIACTGMLESPSWFSDGVGCSVERAADALNRTGIYPQTGPQSCEPPLCALAGSEPHGFGVPARVLWATSRAVFRAAPARPRVGLVHRA